MAQIVCNCQLASIKADHIVPEVFVYQLLLCIRPVGMLLPASAVNCSHDCLCAEDCEEVEEHRRDKFWLINYHEQNIKPRGLSVDSASPEQLYSYQLSIELGDTNVPAAFINGPAADTWGAGVVCFEMLTGDLPFWPDSNTVLIEAPECIPVELRKQWRLNKAVIDLHRDWVRSGCLLVFTCLSVYLSVAQASRLHLCDNPACSSLSLCAEAL